MMDYKKMLKNMISNNEKLSIPIFLIPPSATRSDNYISLRHEGSIFSKVKTYGVVEVFSTPTASPHTQSLVKKEIFEEKSKLVYGVNSTLPNNFNKLSYVPPQIIVWWNIVSNKNKYLKKSDFYIISLLNLASKKKALLGISKEIETSINLIKFFNEDIIIWGSWGNSSLNERKKTGLSRGIPTNGIGHCHVISKKDILNTKLSNNHSPSTLDKLNFNDHLTKLVFEEFGQMIESIIKKQIESENLDLAIDLVKPNKNTYNLPSFKISSKKHIKLNIALSFLCDFANVFENLYKQIMLFHRKYWTNIGQKEKQQQILVGFRKYLLLKGANDNKMINKFIDFIITTQPTLTQIKQWSKESEELSKLFNNIKTLSTKPLDNKTCEDEFNYINNDIMLDPKFSEFAEKTLPNHLTAWYIIDEYRQKKFIEIKEIKIFPSFSSTCAAPERIMGGISKRDLE